MNNWESFINENGDIRKELLSFDGLHLSKQGIAVLENNILKEVQVLEDFKHERTHVQGGGNVNDENCGAACNVNSSIASNELLKMKSTCNDALGPNILTIKSNQTEKMYSKICENCGQELSSKGNASRHEKNCVNMRNNNTLSDAKKIINNSESLGNKILHDFKETCKNIKNIEKRSMYPKKCDNCGKNLTTKENAWKHNNKSCLTLKNNILPGDKNIIDDCNESLDSKTLHNSKELSENKIKNSTKKNMYPKNCENCGKNLTTKGNAWKHNKKYCPILKNNYTVSETKNVNVECNKSLDSKILRTSNEIQKNTNKILKKSKYPKDCENCGKTLTTKENAYKHKKTCSVMSHGLEKDNKKDSNQLHNLKSENAEVKTFPSDCDSMNNGKGSNDKNAMYPKCCGDCGRMIRNHQVDHIHFKKYCRKSQRARIKKESLYRQCDKCEISYFSQKSFIKHKQICHRNMIKAKLSCLKLSCTSKFKRYSDMISHMTKHHSLNNDIISLSFTNMSEFNDWKDSEQIDTYMYAINRSSKLYKKTKYIYYACQFDAARFYKPFKPKTNRRKKVGYVPHTHCPSRMFVHMKYDGRVEVRYLKTHSHQMKFANVKWHRFPKTFVNNIKLSLKRGVNVKQILENCQENQGEKENYIGKKKNTPHS